MVRTVRKWMRKPATTILLVAGVCTIVVSAITLPVYLHDLFKLFWRDPPKIAAPAPPIPLPDPPSKQPKIDPPAQHDPPVPFHAARHLPLSPSSADRQRLAQHSTTPRKNNGGYYWELTPYQGDGDGDWEAFRRKCEMKKNPPMACRYPQRE